jgi:hypothetical protein
MFHLVWEDQNIIRTGNMYRISWLLFCPLCVDVKPSGKSIGLVCCELFAEEDIWTWEGQNEMRLEKTAKLGASWFVPIIKYQGDKNWEWNWWHVAHIGEKRNAYRAWLENLKIKDN